jgi:hypothetical protein
VLDRFRQKFGFYVVYHDDDLLVLHLALRRRHARVVLRHRVGQTKRYLHTDTDASAWEMKE